MLVPPWGALGVWTPVDKHSLEEPAATDAKTQMKDE